jgi:hypothetical protein
MRLIHIQEAQHSDLPPKLTLCEFIGSESERPRYAILSHRWREEEVLFTDMNDDPTAAEANSKRAAKSRLETAISMYGAIRAALTRARAQSFLRLSTPCMSITPNRDCVLPIWMMLKMGR